MRVVDIRIFSLFGLLTLSNGLQLRENDFELTYEIAEAMTSLPLECYNKTYPFKFSQLWQKASDVSEHVNYIPIFSGCFDWHSSVHGHWLLAAILNRYPGSELSEKIITVFDEQFKEDKVAKEVEWFKRDKLYERTYGWSWFLKLHHELQKSPLDSDHGWSRILQPLADHLVQSYMDFLPKLAFPIRVGTHSNTAFGLNFPLLYAKENALVELVEQIKHNASGLYLSDKQCPLNWEPSGSDFLSPCLEEAALMGHVLNQDAEEFQLWLRDFLPGLFSLDFDLPPGEVLDRTDGYLVHLDGLNFSRAWSLYSILLSLGKANISPEMHDLLLKIADDHIAKSADYVVGSDYAGSHWLASFLTHSLILREEATKT